MGFDYEVSSHLLVGGMAGGTSSNYNVSARSSTGTDSSGQVGLYSVAKWNNFYVNGIFNYGYRAGTENLNNAISENLLPFKVREDIRMDQKNDKKSKKKSLTCI